MIFSFCSGFFIFCSFSAFVPPSRSFILPIMAFLKSDYDSPSSTTISDVNFTSSIEFTSTTSSDLQNSTLNETETKINVVLESSAENFTTDLIEYFTSSKNEDFHSSKSQIFIDNETISQNFTFWANETLFNVTEDRNLSIPVIVSFRDEIVAFFEKPQIHQTTLIVLICIGIFGVLSTFLLLLWRFKWSGLSGEWVLHDDYARKQPHIAAFDNDCFSMDSKTNHSCSYNLQDKKCPPFEHEMMELVANSFPEEAYRRN